MEWALLLFAFACLAVLLAWNIYLARERSRLLDLIHDRDLTFRESLEQVAASRGVPVHRDQEPLMSHHRDPDGFIRMADGSILYPDGRPVPEDLIAALNDQPDVEPEKGASHG